MAMTKQELFDAMYTGLAKQGWKQAGSPGSCVYLDPKGCKCAVGQLIPDGHEGQSKDVNVRSLMLMYPDLGNKWGHENSGMLAKAQRCHDNCGFDMKNAFELLAADLGLTVPEAQQ
jgi:hypothetical protein